MFKMIAQYLTKKLKVCYDFKFLKKQLLKYGYNMYCFLGFNLENAFLLLGQETSLLSDLLYSSFGMMLGFLLFLESIRCEIFLRA